MTHSLLNILADTDDFIIVNKPPNIDCMSSDGSAGFFALIQSEYAQLHPGIELKPVHRLDKMTSGLMILAKSSSSAAIFAKLFEQHQIQKYYLALSHKKPKKKQGLIMGDMVKARRGQWKLARTKDNPAKTRFFSSSVVDESIAESRSTPLRLFLLRLYSGKTHQIRVALNSLGSPVLGDQLYGGMESDRGYLHAYALSFSYNGIQHEYSQAPLVGQYFLTGAIKNAINAYQKPWSFNW